MKYQSPLHIIPSEYHDDLSGSTLKKVKKKLLLRFDLEGSTTIKIGDKEYDKNELILALNGLSDYPEYHVKLFKNHHLINFVENGNLMIFNLRNRGMEWLQDEQEDDGYKNWLLPYFCEQLSFVYSSQAELGTSAAVSKLKAIGNLDLQIPDRYTNTIFSKVYDTLSNRNNLILNKFDDFFEPGKELVLKKELGEYINRYFIEIFEYLPDSLHSLRDDYCRWCERIIGLSLDKQNNLSEIELPSLIILGKAADALADGNSTSAYWNLSSAIRGEIYKREKGGESIFSRKEEPEQPIRKERAYTQPSTDSDSGMSVRYIIGLLVALIFLFKFCSTQPSRTSYSERSFSSRDLNTKIYSPRNSNKNTLISPIYDKYGNMNEKELKRYVDALRKEEIYQKETDSINKNKRLVELAVRAMNAPYKFIRIKKTGKKKGLPYYKAKFLVSEWPPLEEMDDKVLSWGTTHFNQKVDYDDYYIRLTLVNKYKPGEKRVFEYKADMMGYELIKHNVK